MHARTVLWIGFVLLLPGLAVAQERGRITGTVTDARTDEGVPGANVVVAETGAGTTTERDGTFTLTDLAPGTYTVRATVVGYAARTKTVRVRTSEPVSVEFRLPPERVQLQEVVVTGVGRTETRAGASVAVPTIEAADGPRSTWIDSMAAGSRSARGEYSCPPPQNP